MSVYLVSFVVVVFPLVRSIQSLTSLTVANLTPFAAASSSSRRTSYCSSLQFLIYKVTARTTGSSISFNIVQFCWMMWNDVDHCGGNGFSSSLSCDTLTRPPERPSIQAQSRGFLSASSSLVYILIQEGKVEGYQKSACDVGKYRFWSVRQGKRSGGAK